MGDGISAAVSGERTAAQLSNYGHRSNLGSYGTVLQRPDRHHQDVSGGVAPGLLGRPVY